MKSINELRKDFPILKRIINNNPLIYFDNAATTQKPQSVIDALVDFYTQYNANIHRGVHTFGEQATQMYEEARSKVAQYINAEPDEIIFTRGTTESINLIATAWGEQHITRGDEIVITELEHHSNLLPWQQLAHKKNAKLNYIPVHDDGTLNMASLPELITAKTKLVAVSHVSNALGTHNDIASIIRAAHAVGAYVLIDAAQSVPHQKINVKSLNCDFLAFSGHKMLGPTGIGVLYIKKKLHDHIPPYQFGGGMVFEVDFHKASWLRAPHKFEAGTPAIAQAIGLGAAIDYLHNYVDFTLLQAHEAKLCTRLIDGLSHIKKR